MRFISAPTLVKRADHGPQSKEIDFHGDTKGLLESGSKLEPGLVTMLVEGVGKGDLLIVVSWQQADLISGGVGRGSNYDLCFQIQSLSRRIYLVE